MLKILDLDNFEDDISKNNIDIDDIYNFIRDKNNIINKDIINKLLWNIIYLGKVYNKSENYYKRSSKRKTIFTYLIIDNKTIYGIIILTIMKHIPFKLIDLSIIINKKFIIEYNLSNSKSNSKNKNKNDNNNNIFLKVFEEFNKIVNTENYLINCYCNAEHNELDNVLLNCGFNLGYIDNQTYIYNNNIYYNYVINNSIDVKNILTTSNIISVLLDYYNLDEIIYTSGSSNKLTKLFKHDKLSKQDIIRPKTLKHSIYFKLDKYKDVVTKNIYDVKEIIDLPEYNYDFTIIQGILFIKRIFFYNIKKDEINNDYINNLVLQRYFRKPLIYNEYLNKLYFKSNYYLLNNINIKIQNVTINKLLNNINKYDTNININKVLRTKIISKILEKYNNKLIITNSNDEIEHFINYKNDIVNIKHITAGRDYDIENIKKTTNQKKKIIFCTTFTDLNKAIESVNKNYNCIYINTTYANYDFIISSIHLLVKLPFLYNTILNALKVINKSGTLILQFYIGNKINTPSIEKLFSFIINLFQTYEIIDYSVYDIFIIKFINYKGINKDDIQIINNLITIINRYEHNEFELEDVVKCIESNRFFYKVNENTELPIIKKQIIYDIPQLHINKSNNNINKFINEYNKLNDNYLKRYNRILDKIKSNNNINISKIASNVFIYFIITSIYYLLENNIIDNFEIRDYINKFITDNYKNKYDKYNKYDKLDVNNLIWSKVLKI
jgi:hypothetical protein